MLHRFRVPVHREDFRARAQQPDQVASIPATRVDDPHRAVQIPAQNLVEHVNIHLPELLGNVHPTSRKAAYTDFDFSRSMTIGGTSAVTSPPRRNTPLISRELT